MPAINAKLDIPYTYLYIYIHTPCKGRWPLYLYPNKNPGHRPCKTETLLEDERKLVNPMFTVSCRLCLPVVSGTTCPFSGPDWFWLSGFRGLAGRGLGYRIEGFRVQVSA